MRNAITVFTLLLRLIPRHRAEELARATRSEARVGKLGWFGRLGALVFAQLADCSSLRSLLHHVAELPFVRHALGIERLAKTTLTDALEKPVGPIFRAALEDLVGRLREVAAAQRKRATARWRELMTLLDATHMSVCLSMFEWARSTGGEHAGVKLHVAYSAYLRAPEQMLVTEGHVHEAVAGWPRSPQLFAIEFCRACLAGSGFSRCPSPCVTRAHAARAKPAAAGSRVRRIALARRRGRVRAGGVRVLPAPRGLRRNAYRPPLGHAQT